MAGWRSATVGSNWRIGPSTSFARSRRPRPSRTNISAPRSPSSARSSCVAGPRVAVIAHRGAETSTTLAYLKSAERFYEPSELGSLGRQRVRLRAPLNRASVGRCATLGLRARPAPDPSALTFLNWGITDISIWAGQASDLRKTSTTQNVEITSALDFV